MIKLQLRAVKLLNDILKFADEVGNSVNPEREYLLKTLSNYYYDIIKWIDLQLLDYDKIETIEKIVRLFKKMYKEDL